jgi:SAM-dependent methyltransferase
MTGRIGTARRADTRSGDRTGPLPELPGLAWRKTEFYIRQSLRDLEPRGKSVLDIGAGSGMFTCYLALLGASRVVALEPEGAGSAHSARAVLMERVRALGLTNVACLADTFQSYDPKGSRFDVVLAHDVINHLDEASVRELDSSPAARQRYAVLLRKLYGLLRPGGLAIIADCARSNAFADLGLRNPLARSIDWKKHQNPSLWCALLRDAGFAPPAVHWTYPRRLRALAPLLATREAAYLTHSHFVLHAVRPADATGLDADAIAPENA